MSDTDNMLICSYYAIYPVRDSNPCCRRESVDLDGRANVDLALQRAFYGPKGVDVVAIVATVWNISWNIISRETRTTRPICQASKQRWRQSFSMKLASG